MGCMLEKMGAPRLLLGFLRGRGSALGLEAVGDVKGNAFLHQLEPPKSRPRSCS